MIQAYFEEWSRRPGDRVRMAVSTPHTRVRAVLERIHTGPGAKGEFRVGTESLESVLDSTLPGRVQNTSVGSYANLPLPPPGLSGRLTLHCWIWPTVPDRSKEQVVWSFAGSPGRGDEELSLVLINGRLVVRAQGNSLAAAVLAIHPRRWYSVAVTISEDATVIDAALVSGWSMNSRDIVSGAGIKYSPPTSLLLACLHTDYTGSPVNPFNGKIDTPRFTPVPSASSSGWTCIVEGSATLSPLPAGNSPATGAAERSLLTQAACQTVRSSTAQSAALRGITGMVLMRRSSLRLSNMQLCSSTRTT